MAVHIDKCKAAPQWTNMSFSNRANESLQKAYGSLVDPGLLQRKKAQRSVWSQTLQLFNRQYFA